MESTIIKTNKFVEYVELLLNIVVFNVSDETFFYQITIHGFMSSVRFHIVTPPNLLGDSALSPKPVIEPCLREV